jgi:hypothetical protein
MTVRRVWMFVLAAASTEGLVLALATGAMHLNVDPGLYGTGAVLGGIVVVTGLLWLWFKPSPKPLRVVGAFAIPVLVAIGLAPLAAILTLVGYVLPNAGTWIAALCALGVIAGVVTLWRHLPTWRLLLTAALGLCGLIVFVPARVFPVIFVVDPMGGFNMRFSLAFATGAGILCAAAVGVWAAALHPAVSSPSQAEQTLPADGGSATLTPSA